MFHPRRATRYAALSLVLVISIGFGCSTDGPTPSSSSSSTSDTRASNRLGDIFAGGGPSRADVDVGPSNDATRPPSPNDAGSRSMRPAPGIWRLPAESDRWETFDAPGRSSRHAPTSEIVAAFDVEHAGYALVLTETHLHTLHLHPPEWEAGRALSQVADSLADADVLAAHSDPRESPNDRIAILGLQNGTPQRWTGRYDFENKSVADVGAPESIQWSSARAPTPSEITTAWRDDANARDWLSGGSPCDTLPERGFGPYVGYLTADRVFLNDAAYCTDYFTSVSLVRPPWPTTKAPDFGAIGATFWHDGHLYAIAAE